MPANQNVIKIFEYALNQEETGKSFFQASLQRMGVGAAVGAFTQLIKEEERHIQFINEILDSLKQGSPELQIVKDPGVETANFFDERAKSEFIEQRLYESMVPDITVFSIAWLIEKDLSEFYEKMANQTQGKVSEALGLLSKWEKRHECFFREYRDKLNEIYSKMPWAG